MPTCGSWVPFTSTPRSDIFTTRNCWAWSANSQRTGISTWGRGWRRFSMDPSRTLRRAGENNCFDNLCHNKTYVGKAILARSRVLTRFLYGVFSPLYQPQYCPFPAKAGHKRPAINFPAASLSSGLEKKYPCPYLHPSALPRRLPPWRSSMRLHGSTPRCTDTPLQALCQVTYTIYLTL